MIDRYLSIRENEFYGRRRRMTVARAMAVALLCSSTKQSYYKITYQIKFPRRDLPVSALVSHNRAVSLESARMCKIT